MFLFAYVTACSILLLIVPTEIYSPAYGYVFKIASSCFNASVMPTNLGWPEAFGFRIEGHGPVIITDVEDTGSAHAAGLQPGDIIVELSGENVRECSKQELIQRARASTRCPPSMVVVSKVKIVTVPRNKEGGFGITLRGDSPVYIRSVEFSSTARAAGIRSGDLILEVNEENVRYSSKLEVLELMKCTGRKLNLVLISGGLNSTITTGISRQNAAEHRYEKAKSFHQQVTSNIKYVALLLVCPLRWSIIWLEMIRRKHAC